MADYESLRQQQGARMLELAPEFLSRLSWPVERLRVYREEKLRALVAHAKARSPWHRRRLAEVDAGRLTEADLAALPMMTKDDLMDHFDEVVTDPRLTRDLVESHLAALTGDAYLLDEYHVCASGGSSGRRGVFAYDLEAWTIAFACHFRFNLLMRQGIAAAMPVMAMVAAERSSHMTAAMSQTFAPPGGSAHRFPATWPIERIVSGLNEVQPDVLVGYASLVHQLAREAAAKRLRIAPKLVSTTSEPLLPEMRSAIASAFGAPILNVLGTTEGLMGASCVAERGLHLSDDVCIVEPVDERGRPVPPGQRAAKIYLTNLYNLAEPLIRYEVEDEVVVLDEPCPCGSTLLRIEDIQGRTDDSFVYAGGPTVHPFAFRSILGRERGVVEYQVRQTARGADVLIRCDGPVDAGRLAGALRTALAELGLARAEVALTPVDALERQASGKLRRFVPLA